MTIAESILAILLSLPQWHLDRGESPEERAELLRPVAATIGTVGRSRGERAFLAAQAWHETRFARYVLEYRCAEGPPGARCDEGRAVGPWQVHDWCTGAHDAGRTNQQRLDAGARCALRGYRYGLAQCAGRIAGAFAAQHTGLIASRREYWCTRPWAMRRAATWTRLIARM